MEDNCETKEWWDKWKGNRERRKRDGINEEERKTVKNLKMEIGRIGSLTIGKNKVWIIVYAGDMVFVDGNSEAW